MAEIVLPTTPSVEWPRYIGRRRKARCWLGGQFLFFWIGFSFCIKPHMRDRNEGKGCRVSLWGDDSRSYNAPGFIPIFLRYTGKYTYSSLLERFSGTWLQEYSTMPRVLEIQSNILYHIEYSYDYTQVPAGYPTFSIAYLIYSTSKYSMGQDTFPTYIQMKGAKRFLSAIRRGNVLLFLIWTKLREIFKVLGQAADFGICSAATYLILDCMKKNLPEQYLFAQPWWSRLWSSCL